MTNNVFSKVKLNEEIQNYKHALKTKKRSSIIYILCTIIILLFIVIGLILVYVFPDMYIPFLTPSTKHNVPQNNAALWTFIIFLIATLLFGTIFLLYISFWFSKTHTRAQVHLPIIISPKKVTDTCTIIVGVVSFVATALGAVAPIILGWNLETRAWYADTKIVLYVFVTATIFLLWAVLIPSMQSKILEKDNEYFKRYIYFEYDEIPTYLKYLNNVYKTRVKEFNDSIKTVVINNHEKKSIANRPVGLDEPFSWDTRRVFRGRECKYGNEYDIVKYILFIEIFTIVFNIDNKDSQLKTNINKYIRNTNEQHAEHFNKKFSEFIKTID
ncbi:MAG: hypothetical protein Ta2E_05470 [Mycoplasmoidaceae bacterium]|nr:MAG: hypothetical protein Ta2E_05470 [Mycoplasmoidaceae bacterium]